MLNRSIQFACSTNCNAAVDESKPVISGMVTIKPRTEPISATQRAGAGLRSLPTARTRRPNTIGNQIATLRIGKECMGSLALFAAERYKQGQQPQHADNHGERVVIDVTGLKKADDTGEPADEPRTAIDDAVDDDHIALFPQAAADGDGAL